MMELRSEEDEAAEGLLRITGGRPRPKAARARVAVEFAGEWCDEEVVDNFGGGVMKSCEELRLGDITICCLGGLITESGERTREVEVRGS